MVNNANSFYLNSRNDYYSESLFPQDPKRYQEFHLKKENSIITSKTISFRNLSFLENDKSIISSFGQPRFIIDKPYPLLPVKVFFYKEKIANFQALLQFHFFENKFFFACYTFRKWTNKDLLFFKEIIFSKYQDDTETQLISEKGSALNSFGLFDNNNNGLLVLPEVNLHFAYFSDTIDISTKMKNIQKIQLINEESSNILKQKIASNYF